MNDEPPVRASEHGASRARALRVAAGVALLVLVGAGIYALWRQRSERRAWEQAVSDSSHALRRCLLGAPLAEGESADDRIRAIALANPPSDEGWPGNCRVIAARLYDLALEGEPRLAAVEETVFRIKTLRQLPPVGDLFERLAVLDLPEPRGGDAVVAPSPTHTTGTADYPVAARDTGARMMLAVGVPRSGPVDVLLLGRSRYLCTARTDARGGTIPCRPLKGELDAADVRLLDREPGGPLLVSRGAQGAVPSGGVFVVGDDGRGHRVDAGFDAGAPRTAFGAAGGEVVWLGRLDDERFLLRRLRGDELLEESTVPLARVSAPGPFAIARRLMWVEAPARGRHGSHRDRPHLRAASLPIGPAGAAEVAEARAGAEAGAETEPPRPERRLMGLARLDEVPAHAAVEVACASVDTFTAVLHAPGAYERWIAFHDPSGWAPVTRVRIGAPQLRCGLGRSTLVQGDSGRLTWAICGSRGCQVQSTSLAALEVGAGPIDAAPMGERQVVVAFGGRRGGLRLRIGRAEALAEVQDTVVVDDAAHGGFDVSEVRLVPRGDHALLLVRDAEGAVRALRVGEDGAVAPIAPVAR